MRTIPYGDAFIHTSRIETNTNSVEVMSEIKQKAKGGCRCGAVRLETNGEPLYVPYCYCESCRKATGSPVSSRVCFPEEAVTFTKGDRKLYESSLGVKRGFCGDCGTPLTWEGTWGGVQRIEVHISTFDDRERFEPDRHAYVDEKPTWFKICDELPRHHGSSTKVGLG